MKRICILLIFVSISLRADFTPENNSTINYTQVLFSWPQIIDAINYQLNIANNEAFDNQITLISESNSYISTGDLDWGNNYFWKVCNHDGLICHELKEFHLGVL